ncbi:UNVERIFIED_CONTAM: hypothetical protein RF648_17605 [Kocuria sp. CPCC 205274]|uniref:Uncharacterized protein n=1 Tax=Herbiconiux daphne TaxID=2970914 RepID=A0ABT2HCI5_9MICO|nr:hypothetical protein [Herbiconiux daphne]MCS5737577.1 hypothetical protein [Herbiconiux daphne]
MEALIKKLHGIQRALNQYHGKPCKVCGETLRYRSNKRCVMCKHEMDAWNYQQRKARKQVEQRHEVEAA